MSGEAVIGMAHNRIDALEKVTGKAIYGVDFRLPNMLEARVLRSPLACARILNVDTSRALRLPGVKAIITGKDLPDVKLGSTISDQTLLARDTVRFVGDAVAAVAAVDAETAAEALDLIEVQYQELSPVFDALEALRPDSPLVHEDMAAYDRLPDYTPLLGTNVCNHFKLRKGDVEAGFSLADHVFEDRFSTQMVKHCFIEPHAAVAQLQPTGGITVWINSTMPFIVRSQLSRVLQMPLSRVRVIVTSVGGSFGGKGTENVATYCAVLARKTRQPVRMELSRKEEFIASTSSHPTVIDVKTGIRNDGSIVARQVKIVWDTGAYAATGPHVCRNAGMAAAGPYSIDHVMIDGYCVYTNKPVAGSFRGFGTQQIAWALESHMDNVAEKLGLSPLEIRLKNLLEEGSSSATAERMQSVGARDCLGLVANHLDLDGRSPKVGTGIACMFKGSTAPTPSNAHVRLNEDGSISLYISAVDAGQGSDTILAQIAAEQLGVELKDVNVIRADTDLTPYDLGTISSRVTFNTGNAVARASDDVRDQAFQVAARMMEANPSDLACSKGRVRVKGSDERSLTLAQVATQYFRIYGKHILGIGSYKPDYVPPDPKTNQSEKPMAFWMYVAHGAEVQVDEETGQVQVRKLVGAQDAGRAINPAQCTAQIEGGLVMGLGYALGEEVLFDGGDILNPSFHDYHLPTALDVPRLVSELAKAPHPEGPYGAKGMGESSLIGIPAAIGNAVYRATGVRIKDLPITAEKLYLALRERDSTKDLG